MIESYKKNSLKSKHRLLIDIANYYLSISVQLFDQLLIFTKKRLLMLVRESSLITQAYNEFLFNVCKHWFKVIGKEDTDVSMECFLVNMFMVVSVG